jgi:hypothetical protein
MCNSFLFPSDSRLPRSQAGVGHHLLRRAEPVHAGQFAEHDVGRHRAHAGDRLQDRPRFPLNRRGRLGDHPQLLGMGQYGLLGQRLQQAEQPFVTRSYRIGVGSRLPIRAIV